MKYKKETEKQRLYRKLKEAGEKGISKMSMRQMRKRVCELKKERRIREDDRIDNGGTREGSGQVSIEKEPLVHEIKRDHVFEEVEIVITDRRTGQAKTEKKKRLIAMLDMLAQEALQRKNISAAKEWLDRTLGKAHQSIEHSGQIDTLEQKVPTKAEQAAARAYVEELERQLEKEEDKK